MPWVALRNSGWWDLQIPQETPRLTDSDVCRLNLSGGLAEDIYRKVSEDSRFAPAVIEVIEYIIAASAATIGPSSSS
jgi:hypothetical protein